MRVRAVKTGFYGASRKYPGDVFEMPEADKKLPRWVQPADMEYEEMPDEEKRAFLAAQQTAGPKRPGTPEAKRVSNPFGNSDNVTGFEDPSEKLV